MENNIGLLTLDVYTGRWLLYSKAMRPLYVLGYQEEILNNSNHYFEHKLVKYNLTHEGGFKRADIIHDKIKIHTKNI